MPVRALTGIALAALAAVLAGPAGAQPTTAPAAVPAGPAIATRFTLPNGLTALVAERRGVPIVTVRVGVEAGSVLDPADRGGLANLTALLLTRGSGSRSALEMDQAIEFVGGSLDAEGGRDESQLVLSVLRKDLGLGLDLLADALVRPAFAEAELVRRREEVLASLRRSEEDPGTVAGRRLRRLAFPDHPYGTPLTGTAESLGRIGRADVVAFHAAAYRPERTVVAVAGDVSAAEVQAELDARLGAWSASGPAPGRPGRARLDAPARIDLVARDLTQTTVLLGRATISRAHPDYYPLLVASQMLGGGSSSRLYSRIREERGLAYSVYAQLAPARYGGFFIVELQCENARVREALLLVREELVRLRRERATDEEVARARAYLVGSLPLRMDTIGGLSDLLLAVARFDLGLDYPTRFRRAILAVTADDVLRAVRAHWDPDALSLAAVGDLRAAGLGSP